LKPCKARSPEKDLQVKKSSLLRQDFRLEPASCYVDARCPRYKVVVPAETDLSPLLPYLNAVAKVLYYDPDELKAAAAMRPSKTFNEIIETL